MIGASARLAGATLALVLLAACTSGPVPEATPTAPPPVAEVAATLRWALGADPTSLDPARIVRGDDEIVIDALFDSLTRLDEDTRAQPAVASAWEADELATTFTFTLDEAARFHDGTPVTADDVVRGLRRVADGEAPRPSVHAALLEDVQGFTAAQTEGDPLQGVRALDERTVEIRLTRPSPDLPLVLAHPALAPVPSAADDDPAGFAEAPIGNGPFALAEPWIHNQFLRLVPAETHATPPALGELVFRIYGDDFEGDLRWADLTSGQVQVARVPVSRRDDLLSVDEPVTAEGPVLHDRVVDVTTLMLIATDDPATADVRVRRALAQLVNRASLETRTNGARVAATALVPPGLRDALVVPCRWCTDTPGEARALIEEVLVDLAVEDDAVTDPDAPPTATEAESTPSPSDSDTPLAPSDDATAVDGEVSVDPAPIRVLTVQDQLSVTIAEQLRSGLAPTGITVEIEAVPLGRLPGAVASGDPTVVILSWSPLVPTAASSLTDLFDGDGVAATVTAWSPPVLDELLAAIRSGLEPERRRAVRELERLVLDEAVAIPVVHAAGDLAAGPSVEGFTVGPGGAVDMTAIDIVGG